MDLKKNLKDEVCNFQKELSWAPSKDYEMIDIAINVKTSVAENRLISCFSKDDRSQINKRISIEEVKTLSSKLRYLTDTAARSLDRYTINEMKALTQAIESVINYHSLG